LPDSQQHGRVPPHGRTYSPVMQIVYMALSGSSDPTRASIPLHLAVNGSAEVGHSVGVVLAGDATELLSAQLRDSMQGVGLPSARELFAKIRQHEVTVYV
jgi:predicted peroxiredoxin